MNIKSKKFLIPVVIGLLIVAGVFVFLNPVRNIVPNGVNQEIPSSQEIAQKAVNYINDINNNMLPEGLTASLLDVEEENGLYKIHIKIAEEEYYSYATKDGKLFFPQSIDLEETPEVQPTTQKEPEYTIGNFTVSEDEICKENKRPLTYFFGSNNCPHCSWEHPVIEKVAKNFEGYISFHNNMNSEVDKDVFFKYSDGGVPTLVLGCKYYRVGSGQRLGEEEESKTLTALICKLTENQPTDICSSVQDLINQID